MWGKSHTLPTFLRCMSTLFHVYAHWLLLECSDHFEIDHLYRACAIARGVPEDLWMKDERDEEVDRKTVMTGFSPRHSFWLSANANSIWKSRILKDALGWCPIAVLVGFFSVKLYFYCRRVWCGQLQISFVVWKRFIPIKPCRASCSVPGPRFAVNITGVLSTAPAILAP